MIEKLDNVIDPENELLLQQLIAEEPGVRDLWEEMQDIFVAGDGRKMLNNLDTQAEWQALNQQLEARSRKKRIRYISYAASAAAIVTAVVLFSFLHRSAAPVAQNKTVQENKAPKSILLQLDNGETVDLSNHSNAAITADAAHFDNSGKTLAYRGGNSTQWSKVTVPAGMDYQVKLSDSTIVWLNAATSIRFPINFTGNTREIEVNGEAYISVAKNASKPFIVHLPGADVHVLGTAFNINSYDSGTVKVALVNGKVQLHAGTTAVELKPGYQAQSSTGHAAIQVNPFDEREVLSWMKGQYIFSNTRVQEIALILQRCYDVKVVLDNDAVGHKRFTGIIDKHKSLNDFLDNLTSTAEVAFYFSGAVLHLK